MLWHMNICQGVKIWVLGGGASYIYIYIYIHIAFWWVICYLWPFMGTKNDHWTLVRNPKNGPCIKPKSTSWSNCLVDLKMWSDKFYCRDPDDPCMVCMVYLYTYIYHKHHLNVGKYTIHGSYGEPSFRPPVICSKGLSRYVWGRSNIRIWMSRVCMKFWLINVKTRVGFELRNSPPLDDKSKIPRNLTGTHVYVKSAVSCPQFLC